MSKPHTIGIRAAFIQAMTLHPISDFRIRAFKIPTDTFEADGTFEWNSTTLLLVELQSGEHSGLGFTYGHPCLAPLMDDLVNQCVRGKNVVDLPKIWGEMGVAIRNNGEVGLTAMAMSAIDVALWDLKAKCLGTSLTGLLGQVREKIPVYGSGGFTNYSDAEMEAQFKSWKKLGIRKFKMKVGRHEARDLERAQFARTLIGESCELFIDANGAYDLQTALRLSEEFSKFRVTWFEQPMDPFDLDGMRELKNRMPPGMNLASGEYIYDLSDLQYGIENQAQDFIQLDATRCKGVTGFIKGAHACEMHRIPISSHCAPSLHVALGCALPNFKHIEYFSDHARIENLFFEGVPEVTEGFLIPNQNVSGHGMRLKPDSQIKKFEI